MELCRGPRILPPFNIRLLVTSDLVGGLMVTMFLEGCGGNKV